MIRHQVGERLEDNSFADSQLLELLDRCSLSFDLVSIKILSLSLNLGLVVHRESITRLSASSLKSLSIILHRLHVLFILNGSHASKHFLASFRLNRYFFLCETLRRQF